MNNLNLFADNQIQAKLAEFPGVKILVEEIGSLKNSIQNNSFFFAIKGKILNGEMTEAEKKSWMEQQTPVYSSDKGFIKIALLNKLNRFEDGQKIELAEKERDYRVQRFARDGGIKAGDIIVVPKQIRKYNDNNDIPRTQNFLSYTINLKSGKAHKYMPDNVRTTFGDNLLKKLAGK